MKIQVKSDFKGCDGVMLLMLGMYEMLREVSITLSFKILRSNNAYSMEMVKAARNIYNCKGTQYDESASRKKFVGWARLYQHRINKNLKENEEEMLADFCDNLDALCREEKEGLNDAVHSFVEGIDCRYKDVVEAAIMVSMMCSICYGYWNNVYGYGDRCYILCKDENHSSTDDFILTPEYFEKVENCADKCIELSVDGKLDLNPLSPYVIRLAEKMQDKILIEKASLASGKYLCMTKM